MSSSNRLKKAVPNFELLKEAYAIIDGIPEYRFNLDIIACDSNGADINPHRCGTVGCAMGWLGMHPKFQALGLKTETSGVLTFNGRIEAYERAAANVFGITTSEACTLFTGSGRSKYDCHRTDWQLSSHKALFQRRVKRFLKQKGQL